MCSIPRASSYCSRQLAERGQRADVVERFAGAGHQRDGERALVEGVEDLERAHELQPLRLALVGRRRRRRQRERRQPEPGAGELPVIGRRSACRRLVSGARLPRPLRGFRHAAEPVVRARQRGRMAADVRDAGEVGRGGGRIVEEPQRDPARHEMALDPGVLLGRLGRLRHRLIGRAVIAGIEQLARHDPPLDPPLLRIVDLGRARAARPAAPWRPRRSCRRGAETAPARRCSRGRRGRRPARRRTASCHRWASCCRRACGRARCAPARWRPGRRPAGAPPAARPRCRRRTAASPCAPCDRRCSGIRHSGRAPASRRRRTIDRCARPRAAARRRRRGRPGRGARAPAPAVPCPTAAARP